MPRKPIRTPARRATPGVHEAENPHDPYSVPAERRYDPAPAREWVRTAAILVPGGILCLLIPTITLLVLFGGVDPRRGVQAALCLTPLSVLTGIGLRFYFRGRDRTA